MWSISINHDLSKKSVMNQSEIYKANEFVQKS